jgi:AraC-like DNA-binding protein
MMPNMDGYELCAYIKNHIRYSHIPVILLTARDGIDSKIEGLGVGADAYIEKPFSTVFLIEQIKNLLNNRKLLKESFLNNPSTDSTSIATSKTDKEFLERINEVIIRNINNEKFSIDQLASELAMSRSSLHHKIKVISQLTPNDFIMIIRLKEAARLLKDTEYRMNEVCYMVGFSSPSYFAKCFYKQFGILPKDYHKKR